MTLRYGSLCSGIEGASVAWQPLGWEAVFFSEVERFPNAVLAQHYGSNLPDQPYSKNGVPNYGDMTKFKEWPDHGRKSERLMGFSDGYTAIPWRGKEAEDCPDSPRYKALGNTMAVNCMRWIGRRIEMVEKLTKEMDYEHKYATV